VAANELTHQLRDTGRLREALDMASDVARYVELGQLGPWRRLTAQALRLQILGWMGENQQVLTEVAGLRAEMESLSAQPGGAEASSSHWQVREGVLAVGHEAASALGRWEDCLDLNAALVASQRSRGASAEMILHMRFNDAGILIRLGRLQEADELLRACQQAFEDQGDMSSLALVFSTRSNLESAVGHRDTSLAFARTAIRLGYLHPEPRQLASFHHNLANELWAADGDPLAQRAHRLAAFLIRDLVGIAHDRDRDLRALGKEMAACVPALPPATLTEVIQAAEQTDGVRLGILLGSLQPDIQAVEAAFASMLLAATAPGA
jgi:hypothetical protein